MIVPGHEIYEFDFDFSLEMEDESKQIWFFVYKVCDGNMTMQINKTQYSMIWLV